MIAIGILCVQSVTLSDVADTKRAIAELGPAARARSQWYLKITVDDYDAAGDRDPKWDDAARRLLCAAAANMGKLPISGWDEDFIAYEQSGIAMEAGCTDPLVIYCRAKAADVYSGDPAESAALYLRALNGFGTHHYNPRWMVFVQMRTAARYVKNAPGDEQMHAAAQARLTESLPFMEKVFADKTLPVDEVISVLTVAGDVSETVEGDRSVFSQRVVKLLENSPQPRSAMLTGLGVCDMNYAEAALGRAGPAAAAPDQLQVMRSRMAKARQELEEAFKLDPANALAARWMIEVEQFDSHGRNAMEPWFSRAVAADPDDWRAYQGKSDWIMHNSPDPDTDAIAFGRECAKSDRWAARIPLTLADAYWYRAQSPPRGGNPAAQRLYFSASPEKWEELQPLFTRYFQEPNASNYYRTLYAVMAAYSGKWKEAEAMFKQLGPHVNPMVMRSNAAILALRKEVAARAKPAADNGRL
jgi:hypothetical protein